VVLNWLMASRRAYADEYAVRVNRAVELLADVSPADAVRALQAEHALSERQARRMVNAALERPDGVTVPERTTVFTVRLAPSLIAGLRRHARSRGHPRIPRLPAPEQGCLCDNERRGRPEVVTRARRCCSTPIRVTPACWPLRTRRSDLIEGAQVIATVAKHARRWEPRPRSDMGETGTATRDDYGRIGTILCRRSSRAPPNTSGLPRFAVEDAERAPAGAFPGST
jgi:hypothetical protein